MVEKIKSFQLDCRRRKEKLDRRNSILIKSRQDIEDKTGTVIEQMDTKYKLVRAELDRVYNEELDKIYKHKREEQMKIDIQTSQLQIYNQHLKDIEETCVSFLAKNGSFDFISSCNIFLSYKELRVMPEHQELVQKRLLYQFPSYKDTLDPEEFRDYIRKHVLGYFGPESDNSASVQLRNQSSLSRIIPSQHCSSGSIPSLYSVGGSSHTSDESGTSRLSYLSTASAFPAVDEQEEFLKGKLQTTTRRTLAELVSYINLERFKGSRLRIFYNAFYTDSSMWICGWNKNFIGHNDTVILNVTASNYKTIMKQKKSHPKAELPTIMVQFGELILFAKKGGNEIYTFNPESKKFRRVLSDTQLTIAALCSSDHQCFLVNERETNNIRILDSRFKTVGKIPTSLGDVRGCEIDIGLISKQKYSVPFMPSSSASNISSPIDQNQLTSTSPTDNVRDTSSKDNTYNRTIVISTSQPRASLRAVNQMKGVLWQRDSGTNPELGIGFNPCSVSASETGCIYFADSNTNKVIFDFT